MASWEYAVIIVKGSSMIVWMNDEGESQMQAKNPVDALNQAGRVGWEVVGAETPSHGSSFWSYGNAVYTLKRALD